MRQYPIHIPVLIILLPEATRQLIYVQRNSEALLLQPLLQWKTNKQYIFYVFIAFNILGGSIHTVKENAEALVVATKEIGLQVNADKTKYIVMSREQTAGLSHTMKVDNSSIERVDEFKYLGTTLTNQNSIQE